ncbi:hypothetical protein FA13DRAFT_1787176 [Coprinellus micaceus]|uniref:Granulins domain-containing protein n=1 Tax=Coprinellus micaceus TaxID=71717 RepID=A0A4Y7TRP3_COPMI|nr:hypothetical protein FA13DRAFT_1787176 [Coprinellus micaceus]
MVKGLFSILAALSATALALGAALPVESDPPELRCPVATDCPKGYTCCGLYDVKLGGYCRLLEPGQYCIM